MADEIVVPINADFLTLVFWKIPTKPKQKLTRLKRVIKAINKKVINPAEFISIPKKV